MTTDLVYTVVYSLATQEVAGSIPSTKICLQEHNICFTYYYKYHSRFKREGVAELLQIFSSETSTSYQNDLGMRNYQPALGPRGGLWPVLLMCNPQGKPVHQQWGH
jgi:hypothetical protein